METEPRHEQRMANDGNLPKRTLEVHFKLFGTDGVSLQSLELTKALAARDWSATPCGSDVPSHVEGLTLPELSYQSPEAMDLRKRVFSTGEGPASASDADSLVTEIIERAEPIRRRIEDYVDAQKIPLLHVRNVMSLPYNLPASLALFNLATTRPDLGFLMQHHDIYWEGPNARSFHTPYPEIADLVARITCPDRPNTTHVLINPLAARALLERKGIQGVVIPDGFDFDRIVGTQAIILELNK